MQFRSSKNDIISDKFWTNTRNVWGIKAICMAFWSAFIPQKGVGHLLERILYTSRYSITQELLQLLDEFSFSYLFLFFFFFFFWQASPVSVWACEGAELHVPHTKRTCLARPGVCLNRTLTTFLQNLQFSPLPTGWHRLKMSEMVLGFPTIWKTVFITCVSYLYKLIPILFFKLVNLVLVMKLLTDHVHFLGIVCKNLT